MVLRPPAPRLALQLGLLWLSPLLTVAACKEPTLHYELRLAGELPASVLPRASYRGRALALRRVTSGRFVARFETRQGERVSQHLAELRLGLPTPCGWIDAPFRPGAFPGAELPRFKRLLEDEERIVGRRGQTMVLSAFIGDFAVPPPLAVTVDWRGTAASARVSLGELPLPRGKGLTGKQEQTELFWVFAPTCAAGRKVQVDAKTVGTLPPSVGARKASAAVVIDVAGGHCYRRSSRRYAAAATSRPPTNRDATSQASTASPQLAKTPPRAPALHESLEVLFWRDQRVYLAQPAAPNTAPFHAFARCPGFLPGRVRCVDLRPHRCGPSAASQETAR